MSNKTIRIEFTIEGRKFEAVSCPYEDDFSESGRKILSRTANVNGGAIDKEDGLFIANHLDQLPAELNRYLLMTNLRNPYKRNSIQSFAHFTSGWFPGWSSLDDHWSRNTLVLRRCQ